MKNANKRLLISIAALVIAIALAATTTFAWFTMDTTPEVNDIDLTVTAQDGLYISTSADNDGTYRTSLTVTGTDEESVILNAITPKSATGSDFKKIKSGTWGVGADAIDAAATDYYTKTFYIRSQSQYDIYVKALEITATAAANRPNIEAWRDFAAGEISAAAIAKGAAIPEASLANAIRVGFVVGDTMFTYAAAEKAAGSLGAYTTGTVNAANDHFVTMYENEMDEDDVTAFEDAWKTPAYTLSTLGEVGTGTKIGALAAEMTTGETPTATNWYKLAITVVVWAEGTDNDCFNEILKDSVKVNIEFSGNYTEA